MYDTLKPHLQQELQNIREQGLYKQERIITSPQAVEITLQDGRTVLNFCANNYLGLSSHPRVLQAAHRALDTHGFGMSSVRFICGTQDIHKELEQRLADFYGLDDTILYAAAFDANGGVFEPLLGEHDAIISDALNHASIIDGVRLCKARRLRYAHSNMAELEQALQNSQDCKNRLIVTDGVFSMDGDMARLDEICHLADQYRALVMVDECHAAGFIGQTGKGTLEHFNVLGRVDIVTGTLGKALGGAMGGYTVARKEIVEILRQRSRPYLFSNSLAPAIVGASIEVLKMLSETTQLRDQLEWNAQYWRNGLQQAGFDLKPGNTPIVPVMVYDAALSQRFADKLLEYGVYAIGFYYPVVPQGQARIRTQLSAAHTQQHLDQALDAFVRAGKETGVLK
jgi:glycine C-acetyltransferase